MFARLWTRGWDFFSPGRPIAYHQWARSARESVHAQDAAQLHGKDVRAAARAASQQKVLAVLGLATWPGAGGGSSGRSSAATASAVGASAQGVAEVPVDWAPGGRWGLGLVRSVAQMEGHMGVSLRDRRVVDERARCGWLGEDVLMP